MIACKTLCCNIILRIRIVDVINYEQGKSFLQHGQCSPLKYSLGLKRDLPEAKYSQNHKYCVATTIF